MAGRWPQTRQAALNHPQAAILFIAACVQAASVAWPSDLIFAHGATLWWLQPLALAALCGVLGRAGSARHAAAAGALFTTVWLSATFWWLFVAMHTYGGMPEWLTVLAIVALAAALSLYYAAAAAVYWRIAGGQGRPALASLVFAALWTMAEMARGTWLTGFGWGAIGYAHADGPLAAFIPWLGAYGVGFVAAWVAATLAFSRRHALATPVLMVAVVGLAWVVNVQQQHWSSPAGNFSVTLLQGNIPQDEKFETGTGVPQALEWYGAQLGASRTDLVVAPETAVPLLPQDLPEGYWAALQSRFGSGQQAALVGIPLGDPDAGYSNSVLGLAPQLTKAWRYDKHHLVPFGEFIPPLFKWFTRMMNIPLGDFNRGDLGQPSFAWKGQRLALNICYEDLFGEELGVRFRDAATAPTAFVNISNIGWFGDSVAIDQHLQISRMRALEFERPVLRATNTGATVVLDYRGQVLQSLPRLTVGTLVGQVEGRSGLTPFAWWVARYGLWPLWLLVIAIFLAAWRARPNAGR